MNNQNILTTFIPAFLLLALPGLVIASETATAEHMDMTSHWVGYQIGRAHV